MSWSLDDTTVWITQHDLRAHADQVIGEVHSAGIHPIMEEHRTFSLGGDHDGNAHQVGGESRPNIHFDLWDGVAKIGLNLQALFGRHQDILTFYIPGYPQATQEQLDHI